MTNKNIIISIKSFNIPKRGESDFLSSSIKYSGKQNLLHYKAGHLYGFGGFVPPEQIFEP